MKYGVYDVDRLISTYRSLNSDNDTIIAVSEDGVHSLEQFILAKYYMTTQVYRHRVRLITDAMIIRGLSLGISGDNIGFLQRLYDFDGSKKHIREWLEWDSVRELAGRAEGNIQVVRRNGKNAVSFYEESTLFRSIDEAQKDHYLDFYAPIEYKDEIEKRKLESELHDRIRNIVEEVLNADNGKEVSVNEAQC